MYATNTHQHIEVMNTDDILYWSFKKKSRSGEVSSIQHYVMKVVWLASSTNKTDRHDKTEILLKVVKHHNPNPFDVMNTDAIMYCFIEQNNNYQSDILDWLVAKHSVTIISFIFSQHDNKFNYIQSHKDQIFVLSFLNFASFAIHGSRPCSYFRPIYDEPINYLGIKIKCTPRASVPLINIYITVFHMSGHSKVNEWLHDKRMFKC